MVLLMARNSSQLSCFLIVPNKAITYDFCFFASFKKRINKLINTNFLPTFKKDPNSFIRVFPLILPQFPIQENRSNGFIRPKFFPTFILPIPTKEFKDCGLTYAFAPFCRTKRLIIVELNNFIKFRSLKTVPTFILPQFPI